MKQEGISPQYEVSWSTCLKMGFESFTTSERMLSGYFSTPERLQNCNLNRMDVSSQRLISQSMRIVTSFESVSKRLNVQIFKNPCHPQVKVYVGVSILTGLTIFSSILRLLTERTSSGGKGGCSAQRK